MNRSNQMHGREKLLNAWLQSRQHRESHDDLRNYYEQAAKAYSKAFNIDLNQAPKKNEAEDFDEVDNKSRDAVHLHRYFIDFAEARESCRSPFSHYLEAPKAIAMLYQNYGERLVTTLSKFVAIQDALLLELMEKIWGIKDTDKVSQATLDQCGYPMESEPDLCDYW